MTLLRKSPQGVGCAAAVAEVEAGPVREPEACAHDHLHAQMYARYRRPLLQVFLQRRIDRDAAEDLLQRTFLQALKKIRGAGLDDPANLGGYLYRTACNLATAYWRGELAHRHEHDEEALEAVVDEALSLEERVGHEQLALQVRELLARLGVARDREVLERFYLREESREAIRSSLDLTEAQFNQVLWRARQRFGEVLRQHGVECAGVPAALAHVPSGRN